MVAGKALDKRLAEGTVELQDYRRQASELRQMCAAMTEPIGRRQWRPIDVLANLGPRDQAVDNAREAIRLGRTPAIVLTIAFAALDLFWNIQRGNPNTYYSWTVLYDLVWGVAGYLLAAGLLGLLWGRLPGRRGVYKALTVVGLISAVSLAQFAIALAARGAVDTAPAVEALIMLGYLTTVALCMDVQTTAHAGPPWTGRIKALLTVYNLQTLPVQLTYLATLISATAAALTFAFGGGHTSVAPAAPSGTSTVGPASGQSNIGPTAPR